MVRTPRYCSTILGQRVLNPHFITLLLDFYWKLKVLGKMVYWKKWEHTERFRVEYIDETLWSLFVGRSIEKRDIVADNLFEFFNLFSGLESTKDPARFLWEIAAGGFYLNFRILYFMWCWKISMDTTYSLACREY